MLGLLISLALSALVMVMAGGAIRRGFVEVGERTYRRGESVFWLITIGGLVGGTAIMMLSIRAYLEVQNDGDAAPRVMERDGVRVTIPASWEPLPDLEASLGTGATSSLAVGGDGAELLVLWPPVRPVPDAGAAAPDLAAVADDLKDPTFAYESWSSREVDGTWIIDASYPSPRGLVLTRHLIFLDPDGAVRTVIATCSSEGDIADCRDVISSLVRSREAAPPPPTATDALTHIAVGDTQACAIGDAGVVACWRDGPPKAVPGIRLPGARQLVGRGDRICAVDAEGGVKCLRDGEVATEEGWTDILRLAVSGDRMCGVDRKGVLRCRDDIPEAVKALEPMHAVALGKGHACALARSGTVACWGDDARRQLGANLEDGVSTFTVRGIQDIVAAGERTCALLATKQCWCWGAGADLARVSGVDDVQSLAAGGEDVCAVTGSGTVVCWGEREPTVVPGIEGATAIAVGAKQRCAITGGVAASRVMCWARGGAASAVPGSPAW